MLKEKKNEAKSEDLENTVEMSLKDFKASRLDSNLSKISSKEKVSNIERKKRSNLIQADTLFLELIIKELKKVAPIIIHTETSRHKIEVTIHILALVSIVL